MARAILTHTAQRVLERRYFLRDAHGEPVEDAAGLFHRVARAAAAVERRHGPKAGAARREGAWVERFEDALTSLEFLPNSPCLMNAGTPSRQLAACFVLPVGDSLREIFDAVRDMALVHRSGGGVGMDFTSLRPRGDPVRSTSGVASGPVSFMGVFDAATDAVKQGGRRRGANMGVLDVRHPDIHEFIDAKRDGTHLSNFNLSVGMPDTVMRAAMRGGSYTLIHPRTGKRVGTADAGGVLRRIAEAAWACGDPGLLFVDTIARGNPVPALGRITATNPCGEQPLLPGETCVLGSIALQRFITNGALDEERFRAAVHLGTRFLDNLVDGTRAPLAHVRRTTARTRKVGLGIMGFADALIALGIPYDDRRAVRFADRVASLLAGAAREASEALAQERGAYPEFARSRDAERGAPPLRNATRTTIAPTGTIALIAGCSSGIEPVFGFVHARSAFSGEEVLHEVHPALAPALRAAGETPERWIPIISGAGTVRGLGRILPKALRRVFVGALEVAPEQHLAVQAAFQRHVESGVSKTVNLPRESTVEDVETVYRRAFELRCKGVTVYRYGSKEGQVLCLPDDAAPGAARECGG